MLKRVFHPYTIWEDYIAGMWRTVPSKQRLKFLRKAIKFTGDAKLYGSFMRRVIVEWPTACEHHLTDTSMNRKAWIGHAATCLAINCPEDITRSAWGFLSEQQQAEANAEAQSAIDAWEATHLASKNCPLH